MAIERENFDQGRWEPRDPSEQENLERIRQMLELANWFFDQANNTQRSTDLRKKLQDQQGAKSQVQRATLSDITRLRKDPTDRNYRFVPKGIEYGEWLWTQSGDGNYAWLVRTEPPFENSQVMIASRFYEGLSPEQRNQDLWKIKRAIAPVHLKKSEVVGCYNIVHPGGMELFT